MQQIQETINEIEQELESSPNDASLLNELGIGYQMLGEYSKAIRHFKEAIAIKTEEHTFHFNLANCYYESEQVELAINTYLDALDIKPDYVPALNNLADIYELAGEEEKARELFQYITRLQPEEALGYLNLGNHYLRYNNTVKAGENYKKAIQLDPGCYEAYNNIGFILKHLGKHEEALPYFRDCLDIKPDYEPARQDLEACREAIQET